MKITLEPRKTTWVPFVDSPARLQREWRCRAEYTAGNALDVHRWTVHTRYLFTGLDSSHPLPSSQLVIMEQGVPLTITQAVVSAVRDRFQSEEVEDPFVSITDKLAGLERSDRAEKRLAKGLLERTWVETLGRNLKVENKTGKAVVLDLTVVDDPASELRFVRSEPEPHRLDPPEYVFRLELAVDAETVVKLTFTRHRTETIRSPVRSAPRGGQAFEDEEIQQALDFDDLTEGAAEG